VAPDEGPHLARQVERLGLGEKGHERLPVKRFANLDPAPQRLKQNRTPASALIEATGQPGTSRTMA